MSAAAIVAGASSLLLSDDESDAIGSPPYEPGTPVQASAALADSAPSPVSAPASVASAAPPISNEHPAVGDQAARIYRTSFYVPDDGSGAHTSHPETQARETNGYRLLIDALARAASNPAYLENRLHGRSRKFLHKLLVLIEQLAPSSVEIVRMPLIRHIEYAAFRPYGIDYYAWFGPDASSRYWVRDTDLWRADNGNNFAAWYWRNTARTFTRAQIAHLLRLPQYQGPAGEFLRFMKIRNN